MKALVLEDVRRFELRDIPKPALAEKEILVRVGAVGICGTDLHIFHGWANYNRDSRGRPIPLQQQPQDPGTRILRCGGRDRRKSDKGRAWRSGRCRPVPQLQKPGAVAGV